MINNDNSNKKRFEIRIGDQVAFMYRILSKQNIINLIHTEVPIAREGKGVGSVVDSKVLDHVMEQELKMAPFCPFPASYVKRNQNGQVPDGARLR